MVFDGVVYAWPLCWCCPAGVCGMELLLRLLRLLWSGTPRMLLLLLGLLLWNAGDAWLWNAWARVGLLWLLWNAGDAWARVGLLLWL